MPELVTRRAAEALLFASSAVDWDTSPDDKWDTTLLSSTTIAFSFLFSSSVVLRWRLPSLIEDSNSPCHSNYFSSKGNMGCVANIILMEIKTNYKKVINFVSYLILSSDAKTIGIAHSCQGGLFPSGTVSC